MSLGRSIYTQAEHEAARAALLSEYGLIVCSGSYSGSMERLARFITRRGHSFHVLPSEEIRGIECAVLGVAHVEGEGDDATHWREAIGICTVTDGDVLAGLAMALYRATFGLPLYEAGEAL